MKQAIIVVDILNDFVTGALRCERGINMVPRVAKLLDNARKNNIPVIFSNDCHIPEIDHEFKLWGPHAVEGTKGAEVVPELKLDTKVDYIVPKRRYSGFFQTNLDILLRELGVDTVLLTGLHANMCVRHTAADAYQLGYDIIAVTDCMDSFTQEAYDQGVSYLKEVYGATLMSSEEVIKSWN